MVLCDRTCDTYHRQGKKDYYVDFFNNFNPKVWYKDLPCVDYASWTEDGEMVISLQQYTEDDEGTYGGCVYSKQVFGSGNYSVDMTPFSKVTDGYISTFYMYSENLTYADHDEIDFGELELKSNTATLTRTRLTRSTRARAHARARAHTPRGQHAARRALTIVPTVDTTSRQPNRVPLWH